jgi:hypothetical protein
MAACLSSKVWITAADAGLAPCGDLDFGGGHRRLEAETHVCQSRGLCCINQPEVEFPLTVDGFIPRAA